MPGAVGNKRGDDLAPIAQSFVEDRGHQVVEQSAPRCSGETATPAMPLVATPRPWNQESYSRRITLAASRSPSKVPQL